MPSARDVVFRIIGEDLFSPAAAKAGAAADTLAGKVEAASSKMLATGRKMTTHLTLPLVGLGAVAVKSATDFNSAMTRIQTQAGGTARDVQVLSKQVMAMKNVQQGPVELANALYHLKSVGLDNAKAMQALRVSSNLASVGNADLEQTTNALAGAWRTGIQGAKNFHQAAATVNAIIGAGNMTLEDFNAALGTGILASAKTFGLTMKDVGSALALFTDEGVNSAAAATRIRMSLSLLAAPSQAADKVLSGIGLSGHQLGEEMRKPNGLIQTIGLLKTHLDGLNNYYPNTDAAAKFAAAMQERVKPLLDKQNLTKAQQSLVDQYNMATKMHEVLVQGKLDAAEQAAVLSRAFGGGRSSSAILSMINNFDVLKKKQDQVTQSLGKYNQAVKAQAETPQAQFHRELADLQRAGVTLGNDLLPIATSLASKIADLGNAFSNLSPQARSMVVNVGIGLAALGPALSIAGRLAQGFALVARAISGVSSAFKTLPTAARLGGAALSGVLAGQAITRATQGSGFGGHTGKALLAVGGSAAAGAATGAMFGGLPGAAIGGLAGTISGVVGVFHHLNTAAQQNAQVIASAMQANMQWTQNFQTTVQSLLGSLEAANGKLNAQYRSNVIAQLGGKGVLAEASQIGFSLPKVVSGALGNVKDQTAFLNALGRHGLRGVAKDFMDVAFAAGDAQKNFQLEREAAGKSTVAHKDLGTSLTKLQGALDTSNKALFDNSAIAAKNRAVLQANVKQIDATAAAQLKHGASVQTVASHYESMMGTLDQNMAKLGFTRADVDKLIGSYAHIPKSVITELIKRGVLPADIQAITDKYNQIPDNKSTKVSVMDAATGRLQYIQSLLNSIGGHSYVAHVTTVDTTITGRNQAGGVFGGHFASGGTIPPNTKFTVGEKGFEAGVSDSQGRVTIFSHAASKAMGVRPAVGYAGGTLSASSLMGLILQAGFRGEAAKIMYGIVRAESGGNPMAHNYNPRTGDNSYGLAQINMLGSMGPARRAQYHLASNAALYNPMTNLRVAYAMSGHGSHFGDWTTFRDGAYRAYLGAATEAAKSPTIGAALRQSVASASSSGGSSAAATAAQKRQEARGSLIGALKSFLDPSNLSTVATSQGQFGNVLKAVRGVHGGADLIPRLRRDDAALNDAIRKRVADANRLAKAQANLAKARQNLNNEVAAVSSATRGGFDITSAGANATTGKVSVGAIRAQQTQELNTIRAWVAGIKKINRIFGKSAAGRGLVRQLAEAGPASYPQVRALAAAGPAALREIAATQQEINHDAGRFGHVIGQELFGGQIRADRRTIREVKVRLARDRRDVEHEAALFGEAVASKLNGMRIQIDDRGIARLVADGTKANKNHRHVKK